MHATKHDKGDKQPALVTQQRYKLPGHTYDCTADHVQKNFSQYDHETRSSPYFRNIHTKKHDVPRF